VTEGGRSGNQRIVYGVQPVRELLRAGSQVREVLLDRDRSRSEPVEELLALAAAGGVRVREVARSDIDHRAEGQVHQGVLAVAVPFPYWDLGQLLERTRAAGDPALLVALDGVTDPHNLGSVARTAEAAGAHGLIVPERRAANVTPLVEKAAAGALAHLPVARVANVGNTLIRLRDEHIWSIGLDAEGTTELHACDLFTEPFVLIVGSEGRGLGRTSQLHCDLLVRLPMRGRVGSLNASVAAAVSMYEARRRRDSVA